MKNIFLLTIVSVFLFFNCTPKQETLDETFRKINTEVLDNSRAYETLEEATKTIGHRLTGSEEGEKAEEYTFSLLKSYGLNVAYQPFEVESWSRGDIDVKIGSRNQLKPTPAVTLAHSPVEAEVTAEIIDMGNGVDADYEAKPEAVKGKIALVYIGTLPNSPQGTPGLHRSEKTALATKNGAIGIIIINQVDGGVLLTGTASVTGSLIPIPAVCIGKEDGMALKETLAKTKQYSSVKMTNQSGLINARNVIATIDGSEFPEEKIIVGGHLDSWDLATGAIDNGIGSFAVLDMARTFSALKLKPKRTVQFIMFMGEEEGLLGSRHLVNEAVANGTINQIKYVMNQDMSGNPIGFGTGGRSEAEAFFTTTGAQIQSIDSSYTNQLSKGAGLHSDHQPFMLQGIPYTSPMSNLDRSIYGCYHSDCDDFDLVNKEHMVNNVRFSSMMLYALANADALPSQKLNDAETKVFLEANNLKLKLQIGGDWRWED